MATTQLIPAPPLTTLASLAVDGLASAHSRRAYETAIRDFAQWCRDTGAAFDKRAVNTYKAVLQSRGLAASSINVRLAAIRKLALEAGDNGLMPADTAAAIGRVKGEKAQGVRCGNWLTADQARALLAAPDVRTLKGKRDRAILALLLGCGVRRSELCGLTREHFQMRDGRMCIVDLQGKGGRVRTIPVPGYCWTAVSDWMEAYGYTADSDARGRGSDARGMRTDQTAIPETAIQNGQLAFSPLFPVLRKGDRPTARGLSPNAVMRLVAEYGRQIGVEIRPHDLRRSLAKLSRRAGCELDQIRWTLGHSTVAVTERYIGNNQDLERGPGDYLAL